MSPTDGSAEAGGDEVPGGVAAGPEADESPADGGADAGGTSVDKDAGGTSVDKEAVGAGGAAGEAGGAAGEAGGTVGVSDAVGIEAAGVDVAGGMVTGGTVPGGTVAGGTVGAIGKVAGGEEALAALRGATGGGFQSDGVGSLGRFGSRDSASSIILGGHAGIAGSVGGSGGQMSLCVGSSASTWARGGHVSGADLTGCAGGVGSGSPPGSAGAGTVCAQEGAGFCIGTGGS